MLKRFLAYAESGVLNPAPGETADPESAFEEDLAAVIASLGYVVDAQVGAAGFRIDLAVRDPERPERYLLAVECDGATYHAGLWARERDRLRQQILKGLGWHFHRVWSTDWFHRRAAEIRRLKAALKAAQAAPARAPPPKEAPRMIEAEPTLPLPPPPPPPVRQPPYQVADFSVGVSAEPHVISAARMATIVRRIVDIEGPVHADEVARRVATLFGKDRAGSRIAAATIEGLRHGRTASAKLREEDGFWCTSAQRDACPVRDRSAVSSSLQRPDMLPPLEIRAAALQAARDNGGIARDEIVVAVARLLGFSRTGPELRGRIDAIVARMLAEGTLQEENRSLRASKPQGCFSGAALAWIRR